MLRRAPVCKLRTQKPLEMASSSPSASRAPAPAAAAPAAATAQRSAAGGSDGEGEPRRQGGGALKKARVDAGPSGKEEADDETDDENIEFGGSARANGVLNALARIDREVLRRALCSDFIAPGEGIAVLASTRRDSVFATDVESRSQSEAPMTKRAIGRAIDAFFDEEVADWPWSADALVDILASRQARLMDRYTYARSHVAAVLANPATEPVVEWWTAVPRGVGVPEPTRRPVARVSVCATRASRRKTEPDWDKSARAAFGVALVQACSLRDKNLLANPPPTDRHTDTFNIERIVALVGSCVDVPVKALVLWEGYASTTATWEEASTLPPELVLYYALSQPCSISAQDTYFSVQVETSSVGGCIDIDAYYA